MTKTKCCEAGSRAKLEIGFLEALYLKPIHLNVVNYVNFEWIDYVVHVSTEKQKLHEPLGP